MSTATLGEGWIKKILVRHLRSSGETTGARVLTELCVAGFSRRADVVLVNGRLSAFEIKGERDNLDRLSGQIETYVRYFERVTVVCAPRHTASVLDGVPSEVGVWEVSADGVSVVRSAVAELAPNRAAWLSYLPVRELANLLAHHGIRAAGRQRDQLVVQAERIPTEAVRKAALRYLKSPERAARIRAAKAVRRAATDPVEQRLLRVQEYLDMVRGSASSSPLKAIPRRIASALS